MMRGHLLSKAASSGQTSQGQGQTRRSAETETPAKVGLVALLPNHECLFI